jgi:hypothetical protein
VTLPGGGGGSERIGGGGDRGGGGGGVRRRVEGGARGKQRSNHQPHIHELLTVSAPAGAAPRDQRQPSSHGGGDISPPPAAAAAVPSGPPPAPWKFAVSLELLRPAPVERVRGRGGHSSAFQLSLSTFVGRFGNKSAHIELRCGRVLALGPRHARHT